MMRSLFFCLLAATRITAELCNQGTSHSCDCSSCWNDLPTRGPISWILISTQPCDVIDEKALRTKLASWSTEECGSSVHCGIQLPIKPDQILLGRLSCDSITREGEISLGLLSTSTTSELTEDSFLPADLLGTILQSREHLLAIELRAHLSSVSITRRLATVPRRTIPPTTTTTVFPSTTTTVELTTVVHQKARTIFFIPTSPIGIALAVGCFILAIIFLVIYSLWGRIEWKQLVEGRWKRRVYRKVPDVLFRSADEMSTVPPPHSTSFHSTTQLIRY